MRSAKGTLDKPGTRVAQKSALNRSIADAAWGRFVTYLAYKAERAGGQVIRVKPHNTSNCCSSCSAQPSRIGDASFVPIAVTQATAITTPPSTSSPGASRLR